MAAKYFVKKVEVCPECEGKQFVSHPAWIEYWKENQDKQPMSIEEDRKWFEDHGWYRSSGLDIRSDGTPDEEIPCGNCEGEGEIVHEVDLLGVLPELLNEIEKRKLQVN